MFFRAFSRLQYLCVLTALLISLVGYRLLWNWLRRVVSVSSHRPTLLIADSQLIGERVVTASNGSTRSSATRIVGWSENGHQHLDDPATGEVRTRQIALRHSDPYEMDTPLTNLPAEFPEPAYVDVSAENLSRPLSDGRCETLTADQRAIKRAFDILLASIFLVLSCPLMLIMIIAIRLDSPGPILFRQRRVGEGGRLFKMYKFRTMVWDAENAIQYTPNYKQPNDPRVTVVGKWLRRLSLDETPQFINVLKGDMSLVGPRPELPQVVAMYSSWQRQRFEVPQGITGWWQVNGRADLPMYENVDYDLFYIRHYSVALDVRIIARTPFALIRGRGAF